MGCLRTYSCLLTGDWDGVMQFVTFIVTLLPVFHGMERSLDLRYLDRGSPIPGAMRLVGDTSVLLVTALFFLGLALSIPDHGAPWLKDHLPTMRSLFVWAFFGFLVFDTVVLVVTRSRLAAIAVARTLFDYGLSRAFLYPQDRLATAPPAKTG